MDFEEEIREELERESKEDDFYPSTEEDDTADDDDISAGEEGFMKGYEEELDLEKQKDDDDI